MCYTSVCVCVCWAPSLVGTTNRRECDSQWGTINGNAHGLGQLSDVLRGGQAGPTSASARTWKIGQWKDLENKQHTANTHDRTPPKYPLMQFCTIGCM